MRGRSPDEEITRDVVLGRAKGESVPELVLCVADATNLRLAIRLVLEMKHTGRPMVLALNMFDIARRRGAGGDDGEGGVTAGSRRRVLRLGGNCRRHIDGEGRIGTGHAAHGVGHNDGVGAGMLGLHIGACVAAVGCAGDVRAVKQPLIAQRRRPGSGDGEGGVAAFINSEALRMLCDGRRCLPCRTALETWKPCAVPSPRPL